MLPSNPDKVETDVFMDIMGDEEFDRTIDAMKDAEQQVLLNITATLVEQMDSKTTDMVDDLCLARLDDLDRMYPEVTGETLPEYDTEERAGRPGGRTYDAETLQAQWDAKVCAAVDMMIETVTEGNESDENGQCGLWDAAQLIIPHLDRLTCSEIGDQCRRRERELSDPTPEGTVVDRENYGEDIPMEESAPDLDYFEIARSIRHKAILFNMAVLEAHQHHGIITKIEPAKEESCVMVKDIRLEMPL